MKARWNARQMLRGADDEGESRSTGVIRALAVTGVFLVAAGMGLPTDAPAQTPAQGQAVGILFFLGASRSGAQASATTPGQKPKPGIAASHEAESRIVALHGTILQMTSEQKNSRKVDRPVELTGE